MECKVFTRVYGEVKVIDRYDTEVGNLMDVYYGDTDEYIGEVVGYTIDDFVNDYGGLDEIELGVTISEGVVEKN